jgi:hypothetical protein
MLTERMQVRAPTRSCCFWNFPALSKKFDIFKSLSKKFDIFSKILFRDAENFFRHQCELVLRHQMQVSNYFVKFFYSVFYKVKNYIHKYSENIPLSVVLRNPEPESTYVFTERPRLPAMENCYIFLQLQFISVQCSYHRVHTQCQKPLLWRTFHHGGKMSPEAEFMNVQFLWGFWA